MANYTLSASITADDSKFEKTMSNVQRKLSSVEKSFGDFSSTLKDVGDKISRTGTMMSIGLTAPITLAGKSMVDAASDFEENLNKVDVAFGDSADEVKKWSETAIEQFGLSKNQALQASALFGDMATSMGLTKPAATDMSISLASLAGDLASFKNIDIEQAMTALSGVFTGETESLKQLGIVMTETNLQEFANGLGIVYSELSQAEKVQLRYNYVMEMTKNAQGDYARTADGTANSLRTFQGEVENLQIALGQHLLPIITPIVQQMTALVEAFASADPEMQKMLLVSAGIVAILGPVLIVIGKLITAIGTISSVIGSVASVVSGLSIGMSSVISPVAGVIAVIVALSAAIIGLWNESESFRESVIDAFESISDIVKNVWKTVISPILETVVEKIMDIYNNGIMPLWNGLKSFVNYIVTAMSNLIVAITPLVNWIIQYVGPVLVSTFNMVADVFSAVVSTVMSIAGNLLENIGMVVGGIIQFFQGVIDFLTGVFTGDWSKAWEGVVGIFEGIFNSIYGVVSGVWDSILGLFSAGGRIFSGIVDGIVSVFKNVVNWILDGINSVIAIPFNGVNGVLNFIRSIDIPIIGQPFLGLWGANPIPVPQIPTFRHGTDNFEGGFALINESGRGEIVNLPNGAQVIPHDISEKYAKESARLTAMSEPFDASGLLDGLSIYIDNSTNVDGTPLLQKAANYTIRKMGDRYKALQTVKGV